MLCYTALIIGKRVFTPVSYRPPAFPSATRRFPALKCKYGAPANRARRFAIYSGATVKTGAEAKRGRARCLVIRGNGAAPSLLVTPGRRQGPARAKLRDSTTRRAERSKSASARPIVPARRLTSDRADIVSRRRPNGAARRSEGARFTPAAAYSRAVGVCSEAGCGGGDRQGAWHGRRSPGWGCWPLAPAGMPRQR